MKELRKMQDCVKEVRDLESSYEDINALIELTEEEEDREMIKEIQREIAKFEKEFEDLRIRTLLSGEYDSCNAIVTLHAGAGGTDSCDWANMLYRMYTRWAERKGFSIEDARPSISAAEKICHTPLSKVLNDCHPLIK